MAGDLIMLTAGGTGGHMFPAEALAQELLARGFKVALVTDRRGQAFGDRLSAVSVHRVFAGAMMGRDPLRRLIGVAKLALGALQATLLLLRRRPLVVVGFGGYPSVPTLVAARLTRVPSVIHEQNAVLGRANRWLARHARAIATSFSETTGIATPGPREVHTGLPVRAAILALADKPYQPPGPEGTLSLLVIGGSQGARVFTDVVPAAVASLPLDLRRRLRVTQQCRPEDLDRAAQAYDEAGVAAELGAFFSDMARRLGQAQLAITRAGASTTAELLVAGVPAILVPLPSAADDHQSANAAQVAMTGAAWALAQSDFTPATLARRLFQAFRDPAGLSAASASARAAARPDAARRLADLVGEIAGVHTAPITEGAAA